MISAWNRLHAGGARHRTSAELVAERFDGFCTRPDKNDALFGAHLGQDGFFGQKAVAGM